MSLAYFTSRHWYWASWNRRTRRISSVLQQTGVSGPGRGPSPGPPGPPPPRTYLFPENMGPKITWGQNHGGQRARARLGGSTTRAAPGPRPAQPGHPRYRPRRGPRGSERRPAPVPARTWIWPRGRLGEPGCTPGTVRQFMAAPADWLPARAPLHPGTATANPQKPHAHAPPCQPIEGGFEPPGRRAGQ